MVESLVSKQNQVEAFQIVSSTYRKHHPTTSLHIPTRFNSYGPISVGEHFGGLVDITTKTALVNG
jgi:hypothetical protein